MDEKKKLVDFPDYEPEGRVSFPPEKGQEVQPGPRETKKKVRTPYYETYDPDPKSTDPSKTTPGAPNIHEPHIQLPSDEDLAKLSPDVDLKDKYEK